MHAVTGITGQVGGAVARALLAAGQDVRAVVRDAAKAESWRAQGCTAAVADMNDAAALRSAFADAESVFVLLPPQFDPSPDFAESRRIIEALRSALEQARPRKVVALSTIGGHAEQPNLLNQLRMLEQALGELPVPVAFLRAAWFMENFAWDVEAARGTGYIASFLQPLERKVPMVACADVGGTAAQLMRETWTGRRVVELQGEPLSPDDVAAAFSHVLDRPVRASAVPRAEWEDLFLAQGMRHPEPRMQMLDGFNQGWIRFEGGHETRRGATGIEAVLAGLV